jgi:hydrogenase maturation protease
MQINSQVLILGLGNLLLQDEGLGVRVLHQLQETYIWPENVKLLDGGVMGLDLLPYLEDTDALLIIDAVRSGKTPGSLVRLSDQEIPAVIALKYSVHQVGLQETLAMAQLRDTVPKQLVLLGIEPNNIALGMRLSSDVATQIPELTNAVLEELFGWGIVPARRTISVSAGFEFP